MLFLLLAVGCWDPGACSVGGYGFAAPRRRSSAPGDGSVSFRPLRGRPLSGRFRTAALRPGVVRMRIQARASLSNRPDSVILAAGQAPLHLIRIKKANQMVRSCALPAPTRRRTRRSALPEPAQPGIAPEFRRDADNSLPSDRLRAPLPPPSAPYVERRNSAASGAPG